LNRGNEFDYSDLALSEVPETEEINPEVAGIEPLQEDLVSRYNPFTKEVEEVPVNWKLKLNQKTGEWHYRPGV